MCSENVPGIFRASDESCRLDIFGSVIIGSLPIIWSFYQGSVARADECLRHNEQDLASLAKELNDWRLLSTSVHGEFSSRSGVRVGKIDVTTAPGAGP